MRIKDWFFESFAISKRLLSQPKKGWLDVLNLELSSKMVVLRHLMPIVVIVAFISFCCGVVMWFANKVETLVSDTVDLSLFHTIFYKPIVLIAVLLLSFYVTRVFAGELFKARNITITKSQNSNLLVFSFAPIYWIILIITILPWSYPIAILGLFSYYILYRGVRISLSIGRREASVPVMLISLIHLLSVLLIFYSAKGIYATFLLH